MSKPSILLIGGGGHCLPCIDLIEESGCFDIRGIVDMEHRVGESVLGYPIIGTDEDLPELIKASPYFLVTVGQIRTHAPRYRIYQKMMELGGIAPTFIARSATCSRHAVIGAGTVILEGAVVQAGCRIGDNVIINTMSLIGHGASVDDHSHIGATAGMMGDSSVGKYSFLGGGATLSTGIAIGDEVVVGAGALVIKNIEEPGVYVGSPVRKVC